MRITEHQKKIIKQVIAEVLSSQASVSLFGSRTDDHAKGGDIDLLVDSPQPISEPAEIKALISAKLYRAFDGIKIDVLLMAPNLATQPIHRIARENGILL